MMGIRTESDSRSIAATTTMAMQSKRGSRIAQCSPLTTGLKAATNKATTQKRAISLRKEIMDGSY